MGRHEHAKARGLPAPTDLPPGERPIDKLFAGELTPKRKPRPARTAPRPVKRYAGDAVSVLDRLAEIKRDEADHERRAIRAKLARWRFIEADMARTDRQYYALTGRHLRAEPKPTPTPGVTRTRNGDQYVFAKAGKTVYRTNCVDCLCPSGPRPKGLHRPGCPRHSLDRIGFDY